MIRILLPTGCSTATAAANQLADSSVVQSHQTGRFVKELKLEGIKTIEGANELLTGGFVDNLNARFAREPKDPKDYHRSVPKGLDLNHASRMGRCDIRTACCRF